MVDREQVRREAATLTQYSDDVMAKDLAHDCLSLLAELEQAEQREAALVEALRKIAEGETSPVMGGNAVAAWELE